MSLVWPITKQWKHLDDIISKILMDIIKEVCVDNITDAINAVKLGADRIEFCSKLDEDGLTPRTEDLISIKKLFNVQFELWLDLIQGHLYTMNKI